MERKHCDRKMLLIKGTWGHYLENPYWKCLKCGEEIPCTEEEKKKIKLDTA